MVPGRTVRGCCIRRILGGRTVSIYLNVYVKFRAFGITFGTISKTVKVSLPLDGGRLVFTDAENVPPADAKVLINERGVKLLLWQ